MCCPASLHPCPTRIFPYTRQKGQVEKNNTGHLQPSQTQPIEWFCSRLVLLVWLAVLAKQVYLATRRRVAFLLPHTDNISVGLNSRNTAVSGRIGGIAKGKVGPEKAAVGKQAIRCDVVVHDVHDDKCCNF